MSLARFINGKPVRLPFFYIVGTHTHTASGNLECEIGSIYHIGMTGRTTTEETRDLPAPAPARPREKKKKRKKHRHSSLIVIN